MEGAVRSGVMAARAVLVASGQRDGLPPLPGELTAVRKAGPKRLAARHGPQLTPERPRRETEPKIGSELGGGPLPEPANLIKLEEVV